MSARRIIQSCVVLFVVALAWNALVHLVVLREVNESVQHLRRPDMVDLAWLSVVLTAGVVALFVAGWTRFARSGTALEGLAYGVSFAVLAGLLVDLNQYVLYPIPGKAAALWFLGGLLEFGLDGVIVSRLLPVGPKPVTGGRPH
ncbi:MAG: hypothetical protein HY825_01410 [Acidobacteria bacterium]|nr:hypothetical protein [Acidobacteriota bacterium]